MTIDPVLGEETEMTGASVETETAGTRVPAETDDDMTDEEQTDEDILTEQTEADRRKYISRTDSLRIEEGEEHVKKK